MKIIVIASLTKSLMNFRRSLLEEIVASGEHEVITCAPEDDANTISELAKRGVGFRQIPMARASTNPISDLRTLCSLISLVRREKPDIVLAYTQKPIIYGGIAARSTPSARFFAMQSGLGFAFSEENRNAALKRLVAMLYRWGVAKAQAVFVFNGDDEAEMRRQRILQAGARVVQVPGSGVDIEQFPARPVPGDPLTFLLVARLMRDKGLYEYASAAKQVRASHPNARFQVLGPFDANPASIDEADLEQWRSDGVIDYLGETGDVRPFLANSTVFVLPSFHREGLPRSILEAMATGRAIITTDAPGCRETVIQGVNGFLIAPRDAGALASAMAKFIEDPALANRMGAESRRLAEQKFNVRIVNDIILRIMGLRGAIIAGNEPLRSAAFDPLRRCVDVAAALSCSIVIAPVALAVGAAIALTMGRPVLFTQRRAGLNGRTFRLVKFRSMSNAVGADGALLSDEERVTGLGRFLRRSRLDEIPELWNILHGEMSLVGPRPLLPESPPNQGARGAERLRLRPGLTGWAQVNGNTLLNDEQKLALDLWYLRNRSLRLDLIIILKTIGVIIFGERLNEAAGARK